MKIENLLINQVKCSRKRLQNNFHRKKPIKRNFKLQTKFK